MQSCPVPVLSPNHCQKLRCVAGWGVLLLIQDMSVMSSQVHVLWGLCTFGSTYTHTYTHPRTFGLDPWKGRPYWCHEAQLGDQCMVA